MNSKKELRRYFSCLRDGASSTEKDRLIEAGLLSHERIRSADTVLLYASFRSEVSTRSLGEKLLQSGLPVAYPKCSEEGAMTFHLISDMSQLTAGYYGIPEPDETLPQPLLTGRTVCIVPGLAFTESGGRLGYGGGFYDRFLSGAPRIYTIAIAYEEQIAPQLPLEAHDIRLNSIVTDERMIICNE